MNPDSISRLVRNSFNLGALATVLVSGPAFSAEPENSIPIDVARILLAGLYLPANPIYSDVMDGFPPLAFAPDFTVLGSTETRRTARVILRTTLDYSNAEAALTRMFEASEWQRHEDSYPGFNNSPVASIPPSLNFCSDAWGVSHVQIHRMATGALIDLAWYSWEQWGARATCDEVNLPPPPGFVHPDLPRLALPQQAPVATPVFLGPGGRGYATDWQTDARIEINWPLAKVFEHFVSQLRGQNWSVSALSTGEFLASASVRKARRDNGELRGIMTLLESSPGNFEIRFRLLAP